MPHRSGSRSVSEWDFTMGTPTPFIPECEILHENGPSEKMLFDRCSKNPGHATFIPVNKVTLEHLPKEYRTERVMKNIRRFCDRTVKIIVSYTSLKRPDTFPNSPGPYPYRQYRGNRRVGRCGTGFIEYGVPPVTKGKPCPCPDCKASDNPKMEYLEVKVQTAAHVVFDDSEAENTTCELFYDSKDGRDRVKFLHGISGGVGRGGGSRFGAGGFAPALCPQDRLADGAVVAGGNGGDAVDKDKFEKCTRDKFTIKCVTHDKELFEILPVMYNRQEYGRIPTMIISHPHGLSKHVTFGKILSHTSPLPPGHVNSLSKYTIGRDVKFQLAETPNQQGDSRSSENETDSSNYSEYSPDYSQPSKESIQFQLLLNSGKLCKPGIEYGIKKKMTILFPPDAKYFCRCKPYEGGYDPCHEIVEFPPGTRFTYGNEKGSFPLPAGVEFNLESDRQRFGLEYFPYHVEYDIDTCQGCSGALIVDENFNDFRLSWVHSGAVPDTSGRNKSGCYFSVYSMGWC